MYEGVRDKEWKQRANQEPLFNHTVIMKEMIKMSQKLKRAGRTLFFILTDKGTWI